MFKWFKTKKDKKIEELEAMNYLLRLEKEDLEHQQKYVTFGKHVQTLKCCKVFRRSELIDGSQFCSEEWLREQIARDMAEYLQSYIQIEQVDDYLVDEVKFVGVVDILV